MSEKLSSRGIQIQVGQVFDHLTYKGAIESKDRYRLGVFLCKCGACVTFRINDVRIGRTTSCGCKRRLPRTQPGQRAGEDHFLASHWEIESPNGEILRGKNLCEIIRNNEHLFDPADVQWRKRPNSNQERCRARDGIYRLLVTKPDGEYRNQSWKGWKLRSHVANGIRQKRTHAK